ncbi:hypothetical protein L0F63_007036, partial [Massospora cicadina]
QFCSRIQGGKDADISSNQKWLMQGESPIPMLPWYLGFTGNIEPSGSNCYMV